MTSLIRERNFCQENKGHTVISQILLNLRNVKSVRKEYRNMQDCAEITGLGLWLEMWMLIQHCSNSPQKSERGFPQPSKQYYLLEEIQFQEKLWGRVNNSGSLTIMQESRSKKKAASTSPFLCNSSILSLKKSINSSIPRVPGKQLSPDTCRHFLEQTAKSDVSLGLISCHA